MAILQVGNLYVVSTSFTALQRQYAIVHSVRTILGAWHTFYSGIKWLERKGVFMETPLITKCGKRIEGTFQYTGQKNRLCIVCGMETERSHNVELGIWLIPGSPEWKFPPVIREIISIDYLERQSK